MDIHFSKLLKESGVSKSENETLKGEIKALKMRLNCAEEVIKSVGNALNQSEGASIWNGSGIHHQIELYLNPVESKYS